MLSLPIVGAALACLAGAGAEALVARMADPKVTWEDRGAAEDKLAELPPRDVLPALVPHIAKGMPRGGIWNSAGREHDRQASLPWQVFYAVGRSWDHQVAKFPAGQGADILLELLRKGPADPAKVRLLADLTLRWTPEAEPTVAGLLKDPKENLAVRTAAGLALILEGKENYQEFLLDSAKAASPEDRTRWYDLLVDPRHKQRHGTDPRVVQLGFVLIEAERRRTPDFIHGAYFLALKTGAYVGQDFSPDRNAPRYQGQGRLKDEYFQDTVKNALAWWDRNKDKVRKKAQQKVPEPPLPGGHAARRELIRNCKGALAATLLEVGAPQLGPPGAADYPSKWKVETVWRGPYAGTAQLSFRVQSSPDHLRARPPVAGKTYILISHEANAEQIAAILDADELALRKVRNLLQR